MQVIDLTEQTLEERLDELEQEVERLWDMILASKK